MEPSDAQLVHSPAEADVACEARISNMLDAVDGAVALDTCTPGLSVSVVIPVYNEHATLEKIVSRVRAVGLHDEILLVDDASTDGSRQLLEHMADEPHVRVFAHDTNRGKGAALRTAFAEARGDVVLIQDADLEYDPTDYPRLLEPIIRNEADVVYGSRFLVNAQQDPSALHRWGNRLLTATSNYLTGLSLTDMETCYKVFRRELLNDMPLRQNRFGFEPELTAKLARRGARVAEVPIRYASRSYADGKKIGLGDAVNAFYCIARYAVCD